MEREFFDGYRAPVWYDGKVLEMATGDGFTTLRMYLLTLNCAHKIV